MDIQSKWCDWHKTLTYSGDDIDHGSHCTLIPLTRVCEKCLRVMRTKADLKRHNEIHHSEKGSK